MNFDQKLAIIDQDARYIGIFGSQDVEKVDMESRFRARLLG